MAKKKFELLCESCDIQFQVVVSDEYTTLERIHSFNCVFCGDDIDNDHDDEGEEDADVEGEDE